MSDIDVFEAFAEEMLKEKDDFNSNKLGTDLTLSSHVPFGVPTRIPKLDLALRRPGYPVGRIAELYGKEGCGKTTVALHAIASVQRVGGISIFVDTEKCWDPQRARDCGIDPQRVLVSDADSIEAIFRVIETSMGKLQLLKANLPLLIVVDSITAVTSESELSREVGEEQRVGGDAKMIRFALRKLNQRIANTNAMVIFVNHSIAKIGGPSFGEQSESSGGRAIKFFSAIRISLARTGNVKKGQERLGMKVKFDIKKSKIEHNRVPQFDVDLLENGFDLYSGLFEAFKDIGYMERVNNTTWYFAPWQSQITRAEWPKLVDSNGGVDVLYENFLEGAIKKELIKPYGKVQVTNPVVDND